MKKKFWLEAISWAVFGYIIPIAILIWKFGLFQETSKISIGGFMGIVCIVIAFGFLNTLSKYVEAGTLDVRVSQCITGFRKKILPMMCVWGIAYLLQNDIGLFVDVMGMMIVSVTISVVVNPFPQWIKDNQTEGQKKAIDSFFKKVTKVIWGKDN